MPKPYRILIVEDEFIVAAEIENVVSEMGHEAAGIVSDRTAALDLAGQSDIALVDLNLRDGPTGIGIGQILAQEYGVNVVFMTANPAQLGNGVPGTIGVLPKPATERELREVVEFAIACRAAAEAKPPQRLTLFDWSARGLAESLVG